MNASINTSLWPRMMRTGLCAFMLTAIQPQLSDLYAQNVTVTLSMRNATVEQVLDQIEKETNYTFISSDRSVDLNRKVSLDVQALSLEETLKKLFAGTNVNYRIVNNQIILSKAQATQQSKLVKGKVVDKNGEPIIGANVVVKGTTNGTITDIDGNFSLEVSGNAQLAISYIGYAAQEVAVNNQTNLTIRLAEDSEALDEVVVVGFATQKKVNLTGSVGVADTKALQERPVMTAVQALQGVVPGLNVNQSSGGMGDRASLNVRGTTTIGDGSTGNPLVLIDGMEGYLNSINPQDIESISVLKDAASSSIYGSRAPFGVILVTTKKGKAGKVSVNYNNSLRVSSPISLPKFVDSYTYALYFNEAYMNAGSGAYYSDETLQRIQDFQAGKLTESMPRPSQGNKWESLSPFQYGNANNDWYDITYKDHALSQEHNFSLTGGKEEINYYVSANFLGQDGLLNWGDDKYKRYTATVKLNTKLGKYITMNYSNRFIREEVQQPTYLTQDLMRRTAYSAPVVPLYDPNGYLWDGLTRVIGLEQGGKNQAKTDWLYQQMKLTAEFVKNWKIYADINYRTKNNDVHEDKLMLTKHDLNGDLYVHTKPSYVKESYQKQHYWNINFYTDYTLSLENGHTFKGLLGFQSELLKQKSFSGQREGVMLNDLPELDLTSGVDYDGKEVIPSLSGERREWATAGFFGRINYDYQGRYLLEANLRYDGTSRFRRGTRWGWFPSVSVGWNLAKEAFMEPTQNFLDQLKLRASYGVLGNQNTSLWYPTYSLMKTSTAAGSWLLNGAKPNVSSAPNLIYSDLTWETVRSLNLGLDWTLLSNRLSGSFDYYIRKTVDMVGPAPELPVTLGATVPKMNNTDLKTYGWELSLSWKDRIADKIDYGVRLSLSDAQTEITNYPNPTGSLGSAYYTGKKIGEIWGYQTVGIAKSQEEMDAHLAVADQSSLGSKWGAGDIMYADLNGDGKVNNGKNLLSDHGDLVKIGNNAPRYRFGLDLTGGYKGFDFRLFFQGVMKRDFSPSSTCVYFWGMTDNRWFSSCYTENLDYFRPEDTTNPLGPNLDSYLPRPVKDNAKNLRAQTRYIQSSAYIRLKNVQLGYTLPKSLVQKICLSNVRVYVSGENLWTGTKLMKTMDPEQIDGGSIQGAVYPLTKVIAAGLSVTF